jgi:GNAT superfamily N-acetyltransferase
MIQTELDAVALSEIDSSRFGVSVARAHVTAENFSRVLEFCAAEKIRLLIARCATSELRVAQKLESLGSLLADTLVYFSFDLSKRTIPEDFPRAVVRKIVPGDEVHVERVATAAFQGYYGHYHADPNLDPKKCDEGYVSWAVRSCTSKQVASEVLVAEIENSVVGFATLRLNSAEEGEGVLFAVAPEAQGSGIYRSFMVSGMHWCKEQGVRRMVVSTQVTNVAVQKVWCRVGFEPAHSYYTFHKWFGSGEENGPGSGPAL